MVAAGREAAARMGTTARECEKVPAEQVGKDSDLSKGSADRTKNATDAPTLLASVTRKPPPPARWSPRRGVWVSVEVAVNDPRDEERMQDHDLQATLDVWKRVDPVLPRGTQPKSKAPCPPLAEQAVKQRKRAIDADESQDATNRAE